MFGVILPQHKFKYFLAMASFRRVFSGKKVDKDWTSCFRLYNMEWEYVKKNLLFAGLGIGFTRLDVIKREERLREK